MQGSSLVNLHPVHKAMGGGGDSLLSMPFSLWHKFGCQVFQTSYGDKWLMEWAKRWNRMYTTSKPPTLIPLMHSALMKQAMRRAPLKWSRDIWHWDLGSGSFWSCRVWEGRLCSGHGSVAYHECPVGMGFGKLPWAFCHVALSIPERHLRCVTMSRCMWFRVVLPFRL